MNPQDSSVQGLVTPPTTKVNTLGEEQVEEISPNTLEAAKTLSKVASLKPRSIDKGRRYKRRKETKGKKVVSSLDFQEEVDDVLEQVNMLVRLPTAGEEVITVSEINTSSIKLNTGIKQASTVGENKGQREGKAPMLNLSKTCLGEVNFRRKFLQKRMVDLRIKEKRKDDEPTKKSGKRRKQIARKGMHTSVDKNDSEDSDKVGEQEENVTVSLSAEESPNYVENEAFGWKD
ncbi:hypothetical protein Tco_0206349 [Tanacetum coccineum]